MTKEVGRWIVTGELVLRSPMAIRTGELSLEGPSPDEAVAKKSNDVAPTYRSIELDNENKPFIPGSALKGSLRALLTRRWTDDPDLALALFGDIPKGLSEDSGSKQGLGGATAFMNAYLLDPNAFSEELARGRTAIDNGTRTAKDQSLRHDCFAPEGLKFRVRLIVEDVGPAAISTLLGLLKLLDGNCSDSALGAGSTQGDGRVEWLADSQTVKHFGKDQMRAWLKADLQADWQDFAASFEVESRTFARDDSRATFPITIDIDGHFLVADTKRTKDADGTEVQRPVTKDPTIDKPWLPGGSIDGALSAQAERIWRTKSGDLSDWQDNGPPPCHELLFGSTRFSGLFETGNFDGTEIKPPIRMEFVAIDRFTGASADGAKFAVAAFEAPQLIGDLTVITRRTTNIELSGKDLTGPKEVNISPAALGLLALTLKDLSLGDIPLGYGTRKGLGRVGLLQSEGVGYRGLVEQLGGLVASDDETNKDAIIQAVRAFEDEAKEFQDRLNEASAMEKAR